MGGDGRSSVGKENDRRSHWSSSRSERNRLRMSSGPERRGGADSRVSFEVSRGERGSAARILECRVLCEVIERGAGRARGGAVAFFSARIELPNQNSYNRQRSSGFLTPEKHPAKNTSHGCLDFTGSNIERVPGGAKIPGHARLGCQVCLKTAKHPAPGQF